MMSNILPTYAWFDNPTPYDPTDLADLIDATRSSAGYFILDAQLPAEYQRALDDRKFIGVLDVTLSGSNSLPMNGETLLYANDQSILTKPAIVCAKYASDLCFDLGKFYTPNIPQVSMIGILALDGSTILQWGINTGFDSPKLSVSPAFMIGLAKRFYFSEARDKHLIFEASTWLGEHVKHRPCFDDFNREFSCVDISPWIDFSYNPRPRSDFFKVTYDMLF